MSAVLRSQAAIVQQYLSQRLVRLQGAAQYLRELSPLQKALGSDRSLIAVESEISHVHDLKHALMQAQENDAREENKLESAAYQEEERADKFRAELERLVAAVHEGAHVEAAVVFAEKTLAGKS